MQSTSTPSYSDNSLVPYHGYKPPTNRQMEVIAAARAKGSFFPGHLTDIIYQGRHKLFKELAEGLHQQLGDTDNSKLPASYGEIDRTEMYRRGLRWGRLLFELQMKGESEDLFASETYRHAIANYSPFGLHFLMFTPTIKLQGSPEQQAYWLPLCERGAIIGTYAQTELGHGTFVRGLETVATFDPKTDEFIIHSPTITSTKFWPGGLGFTCTHAVVMARLVVGAHDHGVHPFIVQLRSLEDHTLLPGVDAGDVGLKLGYNEADNGYCSFFHVRIPRSHMLSGLSRLDRDGTYHPAVHNKLTYGTMILVRNRMSRTVAFQLAQAITIATRYSIVREQGAIEGAIGPNTEETSIIHYRTQHSRLLTRLSHAFALIFASETCGEIYNDLIQRQSRPSGPDHSTLAYTHATMASMKAYATSLAADGTEDARRLCGGHGFVSISGLPELVTMVFAATTFEGENYVMYLQTARYLIKCASTIRRGGSVPLQLSYLWDGYHRWYATDVSPSSKAKGQEFLDPAIQQDAFEHRAVRLIFDAEGALARSQQEGLSKDAAWNRHGVELIRASRAHIELFILRCFHSKLENLRASSSSCPKSALLQLERLASLYALTAIESPTSGGSVHFFEDGYISSRQLADTRLCIDQLLTLLLPDAVTLTDAWDFPDGTLQSALGCYDGNVYERMMQWVKQLPINRQATTQGDVDRLGYEQSIKPIVMAARL